MNLFSLVKRPHWCDEWESPVLNNLGETTKVFSNAYEIFLDI